VPVLAPLLALAASSARAEDLVFSDLSVSAEQGLTLHYTLSPASAQAAAARVRMGSGPMISVQVVAGGMNKTSIVELKEPSRTVSLDSASWPSGLTATVGMYGSSRDFDRLRAPQGSGTTLRVRVDGGSAGAQPLGMPSQIGGTPSRTTVRGGATVTPAPARAAEPVAIDPAAVLGAAQAAMDQAANAQRIAEEQRMWAEQQRVAAEERARLQAILKGILDDPDHPIHVACASGVQGGVFEDCVRIAAFRDDGAGEVAVCMRLDAPGGRIQCFESLDERAYAARPALEACLEAFGDGEDGLRCTNAIIESPDDPTGDVRACAAGFEALGDRISCIERLREQTGDASAGVAACAAEFTGPAARECLAITASGGPGPDAIAACADAFDDKDALECLRVLRPTRSGAGLVPACAELFDAPRLRLQCLERARGHADAERVAACAEQPEKKRLRCVEDG
jgi:hypothetical protein